VAPAWWADSPSLGAELPGISAAVEAEGFSVDPGREPPLKRVPRSYPADHPRTDLLTWKGITAGREFGVASWLHTTEAKARIVATWQAAAPLNNWIDRHGGPSRELPREFRALVGD
jgi:hypothetical protein